jgi:hypothetical protein
MLQRGGWSDESDVLDSGGRRSDEIDESDGGGEGDGIRMCLRSIRLCIESFGLSNDRAGRLLLIGVRRAVRDRVQAWIDWDAKNAASTCRLACLRLLSIATSPRDVTTKFATRLKVGYSSLLTSIAYNKASVLELH